MAVTLTRLSHRIMLAWGWRRAAIAFAAGAASVLAMAPFGAWPILFVTFPVLVWLIDGSAGGRFGGVLAAARDGLEEAIIRVESEAPVTAGAFRRLLDALANIGL